MIQKICIENDGNVIHFIYIPNFLSPLEIFFYQVWIYLCVDFLPVFTYNSIVIRYQRWYHKKMNYFNENWPIFDRWKASKYPAFLYFIEKKISGVIEKITNTKININSCLINKYSQKNHRLYYHRDSADVFGLCPTITSVTIGNSASIHIRRVGNSIDNDDFVLRLESGSLFIMSGFSQVHYHHAIKMNDGGVRYSMVFREHNKS